MRTSPWARIPIGFHHQSLLVSQDGLRAEQTKQYCHTGLFLSEALECGFRFTVKLAVGGSPEQFYLGVTLNSVTNWDFLPGVFFHEYGITDWCFPDENLGKHFVQGHFP